MNIFDTKAMRKKFIGKINWDLKAALAVFKRRTKEKQIVGGW